MKDVINSFIGRFKMRRIFILLAILSAIWGCAGIPMVSDKELKEAMQLKGDPAAGKAVYEKNCIYCHRAKGEGGGVAVGTLERAMPKRDEDLYRAIKEGKGDWMPAFSKMTPKDTVDVIAYIRSLFPGR